MKAPFAHQGDPFEQTSVWQPATFVVAVLLSCSVLLFAGVLAVGYWRTLPNRSGALAPTTPKPPTQTAVSEERSGK